MKIAVCDDEKIYVDEITEYINNYIFETDADITTDAFTNPLQLLEKEKYDLYLLDYVMPEINGVELAVKLREKFSECFTLCFLTSYETAAIDVINKNINAESFLLKPVNRSELFAVLNRVYNSCAVNRIVLKKGKNNTTICPADIIYAEAQNKSSILYFEGKSGEFPYLLSELFDGFLAGNGFFRVHRSYVINMRHVAGFDKSNITMDNGAVIPCRKIKEFRAAFDSYNFNSF